MADKDVSLPGSVEEVKAAIPRQNERTLDEMPQDAPRQSFQLRALTRKTISYQKRQVFTNVFCIVMCPGLMVIIASLLGFGIQKLIDTNNPLKEIVYCSNTESFEPNGVPIVDFNASFPFQTLPKASVPGATQDKVYQVNYLPPIPTGGGPPGAAFFLNAISSCVYDFGPDYQFQTPYERDPQASDSKLVRDTTFWPQVTGGWLGFLRTNLLKIIGAAPNPNPTSEFNTTSLIYLNAQSGPWYLLAVDSSINAALVGSKAEASGIPIAAPLSSFQADYFNVANLSTGVLETFPTRYFLNTSIGQFKAVPFFKPISSASDVDKNMDSSITDLVQSLYIELSKVDKSIFFERGTISAEARNKYLRDVSAVTVKAPHGGVIFNEINHPEKKYKYTLQIGNERRLSKAGNFLPEGQRRMIAQTMMSNALLRTSNPTNLGDAQITQSIRAMPSLKDNRLSIPIGSIVGGYLFPFGVSFLLPIFVITLVKEKEDRILVMMKMNGLKAYTYYVSHFLHFYFLHILASAVFIGIGALVGVNSSFRLDFFSRTDPGVLILLFFIWGFAQIGLSFVLACFFSKSRTSLIITFLLVLASVILNIAISQLYRGSDRPSEAYFLWPPFAFYRALVVVNRAAFTKSEKPYTISRLVAGDEVLSAIIFLIFESILLFFLAWYLNNVIPTEYGTTKPWHFIFTEPYEKFKKRRRAAKTASGSADSVAIEMKALDQQVDDSIKKIEDQDVSAERERVLSNSFDPKSPLIMKRMRKVYGGRGGLGPKLAVKDVTFAVEEGLIFGLLGPNGAGKTTLISILTGLYTPTSGEAKLAGFDISTQMDQVYKNIGVCPQHDILWDDLTVEEHLLFYARLKGVPSEQEKMAVQESMKAVSLQKFAARLSKGLSGGEKRRLSIAIALVGSPSVVFLDEPTTGLDPEVRRLIWTIINNARAGKTIVLTTHSMEEAEVLCQRIGIMAKGALRCLGPQVRLKQLYGSGFRLYITCEAEHTPGACAFIESLLPTGWTRIDSFETQVSYEFKPTHGMLSNLFVTVEANKSKYGIDDWGLSQTSLEEVFLKIISETDAEAD